MTVTMHRFPRLHLLFALVPLILLFLGVKDGTPDKMRYVLCLSALSVAIFLFLSSPLQKVTFDLHHGVLRYYLFFLIKREIPFAEIEDWEGHTTSTTKYNQGKRTTAYTHTITVYTTDGDSYSFQVFAREKKKEFDIKLRSALDQ